MLNVNIMNFLEKEGKAGLTLRLNELIVELKRFRRNALLMFLLSLILFIASIAFFILEYIDVESVILMKFKIIADIYFLINLIIIFISGFFLIVSFKRYLKLTTAIKSTEMFLKQLPKIKDQKELYYKVKSWLKKLGLELGTPRVLLSLVIFDRRRKGNLRTIAL